MAQYDNAVVRGHILQHFIANLRIKGWQILAQVTDALAREQDRPLRVLVAKELLSELRSRLDDLAAGV